MAEKITLKSDIKVFDIENEEGRVLTQLRLDPHNDANLGRFMDLYDNITKIAEDVQAKIDATGAKDSLLTMDMARKVDEINNEAVKAVIRETDAMFGAGFTREIFAEHYEADPSFIPNVALFKEFYEKVMPVIQSVYKTATKNYSVKKRS